MSMFLNYPSVLVRRMLDTRWSWIVHLVAFGSLLLALFLFVVVVGMMIRGQAWAFIIYAENPYSHLGAGLLFLGAAYFLRFGYRNDRRAWGKIAGRCVLMLMGLTMAAIVGEIGVRYILIKKQEGGSLEQLKEGRGVNTLVPTRHSHALAYIINLSEDLDLVFELKPNLDMEFGNRQLRTNSRGMRSDKEYSIEKPAGTRRVIGLGDSGMFGWGVEQGEQYMAVLEKLLNEGDGGHHYEVMNLAVPGYNTQLEVESLVYKGLKFKPDVVILGWCVNDFQLPFFMLEREDFTRRDLSFLHVQLFRRKDMGDLVAGRRVRSLRGYDTERLDEGVRGGAGAEGVLAALKRLKALSEEHGFQVLVSGPLDKKVVPLIQEVGLHYVNFYEMINADEYPKDYGVYFMHPRAGGHEVIAQLLRDQLMTKYFSP